jgi:hypothetical protein
MADTAALTNTRTHAVEHDGRTWTLVPGTRFGIQGQFESWQESRRWEAAQRGAERAPSPEAAALVLDRCAKEVADLEYSFGGLASTRALNAPEGLAYFVWLSMKAHHKDATLEDARALVYEAPEAVLAAMRHLNPRLFPAPPENGAPKAPPPSTPAPPGGSAASS